MRVCVCACVRVYYVCMSIMFGTPRSKVPVQVIMPDTELEKGAQSLFLYWCAVYVS